MHSAKGLEWRAVYIIQASDGAIPAHQATGDAEQLEEERRLFYVALTRARDWLYVTFPLAQLFRKRGGFDGSSYAQLSRFITDDVTPYFQCCSSPTQMSSSGYCHETSDGSKAIRHKIETIWS